MDSFATQRQIASENGTLRFTQMNREQRAEYNAKLLAAQKAYAAACRAAAKAGLPRPRYADFEVK